MSLLYGPTLISVLIRKPIALTIWIFVTKVMSLLSNTLSGFVIAFLPRSTHLNFVAAVTVCSDFAAQENKICLCFHFLPLYLPESDGTKCHDLIFSFSQFWVSSQLFHYPLSPWLRGSPVPLHFLPLEWHHLPIWGCWYFSQKSWFQLAIHPAQPFAWCTLHRSWINRVTTYSLTVLLSQFWASQLFHVCF